MTDRDNITLPREVVQFMLQHLEWWSDDEPQEKEAITALRTALAAEPTKQEPGLMEGLTELARQMKPLDADMAAILNANLDSLYIEDETALAAEQPKPEPVAWMDRFGSVVLGKGPYETFTTPLYAAPPEDESLRRDAERYRWLKAKVEDYDGNACFPEVPYPAPIPDCSPFDAVDAAIDAAMQEGT